MQIYAAIYIGTRNNLTPTTMQCLESLRSDQKVIKKEKSIENLLESVSEQQIKQSSVQPASVQVVLRCTTAYSYSIFSTEMLCFLNERYSTLYIGSVRSDV